MITITIANNKGGTGKTTTAVTLATGLARLNRNVVLVDTDAQGHVALYLGLDPADSIFDLLIVKLPITECLTFVGDDEHLAVIRSDTRTAVAKLVLGAQPAPIDTLTRALDPLRSSVDFCIIDGAPSTDSLSLGTLYAADYVLTPALCETLSLAGVRDIVLTINNLRQQYQAATRLLGVLPTKYRRSTKEHRYNLALLAEAYGRLIYPPIPLATAVAESTARQEPLWTYAPRHPATAAYNRVLERMLSDVESASAS